MYRYFITFHIVLSLMPSICHGGIFVSKISDLKVEDITLVEVTQEKNEDKLWKLQEPGTKVLKVQVSTSNDLVKLSQKKELTPYVKVSQCPLNSETELNFWSHIYYRGQIVEGGGNNIIYKIEHRYWYTIYFYWKSSEWKNLDNDKPPHPAYNLANKPNDVCLQILGGAMWGFGGLETNTVVIPIAMISKALASVRVPLGL